MARNLKAVDRCPLKQDLTTRLSSLTSSALTAAALESVMTSVLDDHAPATRRKVSARCDPWFSTVAEQARTAKRHKRQTERQWKKHPVRGNFRGPADDECGSAAAPGEVVAGTARNMRLSTLKGKPDLLRNQERKRQRWFSSALWHWTVPGSDSVCIRQRTPKPQA
ncbi:hypothetical protein ACOMHN_007941 [Nucella lapillus]